MHMSAENTAQAYAILQRGNVSVPELAESWGLSPSTVYGALARHKMPLRRPKIEEQVEAQRASDVPPEVYAWRAGISVASLKKYAYDVQKPLNMSSYATKKDWWLAKLDQLDPQRVQAFCIREHLPVHQLAYWFHKIENPSDTLLWGFTELRIVDNVMFNDIGRFHNPHAPTHVIGRGKSIAQIDIRVATEAYGFSRAYQ